VKLYTCSNCNNLLYFENSICLRCNNTVGFDANKLSLVTVRPADSKIYVDVNDAKNTYRFCANAAQHTCNWLIPLNENALFCKACALNRIIPALTSWQNIKRWQRIEQAKHRLVYSLFRLCLPVKNKTNGSEEGIAFEFMADVSPKERVITGHLKGTITLNIEEADETERTRNKSDLGEKYRTLLGHFRHETGHYYWDLLIKNNTAALNKFRQLFGDERKNYTRSLEAYYNTGAFANWNEYFISPYASSHAWEDWSETWAHYMLMMDTLETAFYFGIGIHPGKDEKKEINTDIIYDPYTISDFDIIIKMWLPFTFAANSLNRSMGYTDFYPFVISPAVKIKLQFIHNTCSSYRDSMKGQNILNKAIP
jgi:hypothetical protein